MKITFLKEFSISDFLLIFLVSYLFFPTLYLPGGGIDPSWQLAINYAFDKDLIFGKDIVFTYGPLGFLQSRQAYLINKLWFIFFDLFFLSLTTYALFKVYKSFPFKKIYSALIILALSITSGDPLLEIGYVLFFCFIFLIITNTGLSLSLASFISVLAFFIKLNTGFVYSALLFISIIINTLFNKRVDKKSIAALVSYGGFISLFAILLPVDIKPYFTNSLTIIDGYQDAMFLDLKKQGNYLFLHIGGAYLLLSLMMIGGVIKANRNNPLVYILTICSLGYTFILYKSTFLRADYEHIVQFLKYLPFPFLLFPVLVPGLEKRYLKSFIVPIVALSFIIVGLHRFGVCFVKAGKIGEYFQVIAGGDDFIEHTGNFQFQKLENELPMSFISEIGDKSIDIFPWDIAQIIINKLNYKPRPVFQSYQTYSAKLDRLNSAFYNSPYAPEFVIYKINAIDDRYNLLDDALTRFDLLKNYEIVKVSFNALLLKKRVNKLKSGTRFIKEVEIKLGSYTYLQYPEKLITGDFSIDYSYSGKLQRFFFQPPPLFITFKLEDSTEFTFKAPVKELQENVLLNNYIGNAGDAATLFFTRGELNKRIVAFKLSSNSKEGFADEIKVRLHSLTFSGMSSTVMVFEDSIPKDSLNKISFIPDSGKFLTEEIRQTAGYVKVDAVDFYQKRGEIIKKPDYQLSILLQSNKDNANFIFPAFTGDFQNESTSTKKEEVVNLKGRKFTVLINKKTVPSGSYSIYYLIRDDVVTKAFFQGKIQIVNNEDQ